ncbi:MAG: hypothetical protein CSB49_05555 [Proteobacteria bacterium]|nr:MAG: hypothetical protein CSB49_05555 [Pseudomonadota bacterium]
MQHPTKRLTQVCFSTSRPRRTTVQTVETHDPPDDCPDASGDANVDNEIQNANVDNETQKPRRRAGSTATRLGGRALPLGPALRIQQAQGLTQRLMRRLGHGSLDLALTDNRSVMITVRRDAPRRHYDVRVHHLFCDAPEEIVDALARYIVLDDRKASRALGRYIDFNDHRIREPSEDSKAARREVQLRTEGKHHDLQATFNVLNERYFKGEVSAGITWGRNAARGKARSSVRLGSYTVEERLIRIHPGLDQGWIPPVYLQWVVFHEMLHAVLPIPTVNGRRQFHTRAFNEAEARFEGIAEARTWEHRHLPQLLRI